MFTPVPKSKTAVWFAVSLFFLLYSAHTAFSQPYYVYQKTFNEQIGMQDQIGYELQQTNDNGYAIGGFYGNTDGFFYLLKTNSTGNWQWTAPLRGEFCYGKSMQQTADNSYIMAGYRGNAGLSSIQVMKYFSTGLNDWATHFEVVNRVNNSLNEVNVANCIRETSDEGYILTGYTRETSTRRADLVLAKLNRLGAVSWVKTWEYPTLECLERDQIGHAVEQTSDGGYVLAGEKIRKTPARCLCIEPPGCTWSEGIVVKTDNAGNEVWRKEIYYFSPGTNNATLLGSVSLKSIKETSDGGYVATGYCTSYTPNPQGPGYTAHKDVLLVKLFSDGNTDWMRVYSTEYDEEGYSIKQTSDGGYIVAGMHYAPGYLEDAMLMRLNPTGQIIWAKAYGWSITWSFQEYAYSVVETFDALGTSIGYAFTGYQRDTFTPNKKVFLVQTSPAGNASIPGASSCYVREIPFATIEPKHNIFEPLGAFDVQVVEGAGSVNAIPQTVESITCDIFVNEKRSAGEDVGTYSDDADNAHVSAYPNPATGESIGVRYELGKESTIRIVVIDMLGRTVYNYSALRLQGTHEETIDIRAWSKGAYTLVVYNGQDVIQRKMIQIQ